MNLQNCCFNISEDKLKACWILTNSCNLHCDYCATHASDEVTNQVSPICPTITERVVENCQKAGIRRIILSGGEPLLVRNICDAVYRLSKSGLIVSISTNGILLSERLLNNLGQVGLSKLIIGIDCSKIGNNKKIYPSTYPIKISHILHLVEKTNIKYELSMVFLAQIQHKLNVVARWLKHYRPLSINLIEPQSCGRLATPSQDIYHWEKNQMQKSAEKLEAFLSPTDTAFVVPKCRDQNCPSQQFMFGFSSKGTLEQCPWKNHLKNELPKYDPYKHGSTKLVLGV